MEINFNFFNLYSSNNNMLDEEQMIQDSRNQEYSVEYTISNNNNSHMDVLRFINRYHRNSELLNILSFFDNNNIDPFDLRPFSSNDDILENISQPERARTEDINIPVYDYEKVLQDTEKEYDNTCSICLIDFNNEDKVSITECDHIYHNDCIKKWLRINNTCCICKQELKID